MSKYFQQGEHYLLMEPLFSFDQFTEFEMKEDGKLHANNGLTLDPILFKGRTGQRLMAWQPHTEKK